MALETCFIGETIQYHSPIRLNKTQVMIATTDHYFF